MDVASPLMFNTVAVAASAAGGGLPPTGDVAADAARFAQLMAQPAPAAAASGAVDPLPAVDAVGAVAPTRSFGDAILSGVGALGDTYAKSMEGMNASIKAGVGAVDGASATPAALIEVQGKVAHWNLLVELYTSCGKQSTQSLNDLTKLQ